MVKNVTIAGGGVLGSQIAFQTAVSGFNVTVYDIDENAAKSARKKIDNFIPSYVADLGKDEDELKKIADNITYTTNLKEAAQDADLVIEAIAENLDIKRDFYSDLNEAAGPDTIFATNSSSLLPSDFKDATGRPDKFLAIHFANEIWKRNIAEVMGTEDTDPEVYQTVKQFAQDIHMVPIELNFEKAGYVLNSLLIPILDAAKELLGKGIATVDVIDKTWMKAGGNGLGPFGILDMIGLRTDLEISKTKYQSNQQDWLKGYIEEAEEKVEKGQIGKQDGKGFYDYPNPAFESDDFFNNPEDIKELKHGFKKVLVAGAGVLGSQIAYLTATGDFQVVLYDIDQDAIDSGKERLEDIAKQYAGDMDVSQDQADKYLDNISLTTDIKEAADDVDLVIEAVSENPDIKRSFYGDLTEVLPDKAYIATNTSSLLPSDLEGMTDRPEKFASLHFANRIWKNNTGEVMPGSQTSDEFFDKLLAFARDIHLLVLPLKKEKDGYILNSILIPHLIAALDLVASGAAEVETIDKTWMISQQVDRGPFAKIDRIGLETVKNIISIRRDKAGDSKEGQKLQKILDLLNEKIDKNEGGMGSGKGFYTYPDPAFEQDAFLKA
ncbi:3-hydroxybutyryl-CoA dehydrogenase [Alloiococcus otitis]|mgnify:FL=1|uniref:3-hydroxyacyl-CoA dehydrogenase n=1 Tax=Alloiococcus otitis ATCC 51267 TaxID=883081 RepID=K9EX60_9LACT|nr:3-hydroxyacyl-CoA dehydrogenase [Alloiococcus otitis]EKU93795.1 hypothetical protein HMPREF9698_00743 [Alloiococcus otitis ATCC 51267]SUU80223.1 3-hydroxybutyryl-CoA dehydrogenase [Alloiococcus otitis]